MRINKNIIGGRKTGLQMRPWPTAYFILEHIFYCIFWRLKHTIYCLKTLSGEFLKKKLWVFFLGVLASGYSSWPFSLSPVNLEQFLFSNWGFRYTGCVLDMNNNWSKEISLQLFTNRTTCTLDFGCHSGSSTELTSSSSEVPPLLQGPLLLRLN